MLGPVANEIESRASILIPVAIALLLALAWSFRFIQDDAFISFRYAENLARGLGLNWNEGERVEGYSNLLWTLLISVGIYLKLDPVKFSYVLGLACFVTSLAFTYKLSSRIFASKSRALIVMVLLGTNFTFLSYATGGLETQLQAALIISVIYFMSDVSQKSSVPSLRLLTISILLSLAVLTRHDSMLVAATVFAYLLITRFSSRPDIRTFVKDSLWLLLPFAAIVGACTVWRFQYYGELLPNSYFVKVATQTSLTRGLSFLFRFLWSYWLLAYPIFFLICLLKRARLQPVMMFMAVLIPIWGLYVLKTGGDFMEYRFLVPILPAAFILIGWSIFNLTSSMTIQSVLIALVLAGSLHHAVTFRTHNNVEDIGTLQRHLDPEGYDWIRIGRVLGESLKDTPITIATTAAGAVPFYSRLKTIDMYGVNDKWVARNGRILGSRPGHQRGATLQYVLSRDVNMVLGNPVPASNAVTIDFFKNRKFVFDHFRIPPTSEDEIPPDALIVEIPIRPTRKLFVLYLIRKTQIDQLIERNGWRYYPVDMLPVSSDNQP